MFSWLKMPHTARTVRCLQCGCRRPVWVSHHPGGSDPPLGELSCFTHTVLFSLFAKNGSPFSGFTLLFPPQLILCNQLHCPLDCLAIFDYVSHLFRQSNTHFYSIRRSYDGNYATVLGIRWSLSNFLKSPRLFGEVYLRTIMFSSSLSLSGDSWPLDRLVVSFPRMGVAQKRVSLALINQERQSNQGGLFPCCPYESYSLVVRPGSS